MIVSTTKFRLKSLSLYIQFFVDTYRVVKQVKCAGGIVHMRMNPVSLRTITVWQTSEDLLAFRNSGAHLHAMKKSRSFGEISSVTWESEVVPSWSEAKERLQSVNVVKRSAD